MSYEKQSITKHYLKKFYDSDLFMAVLIGLGVAAVYIELLRITG